MCGDYPVTVSTVEQGVYQIPFVLYKRAKSTSSLPVTPDRGGSGFLGWHVVPQTARTAFQYEKQGLHTSASVSAGTATARENVERYL